MTTDDTLPSDLELEAGVDAPLLDDERKGLGQLGALLRVEGEFELSPAARERGRAELEALLREGAGRGKVTEPAHGRRRRARPPAWLWLAVPLAAAMLFAWLLPRYQRAVPAPAASATLAVAQSALLTAELTGAPIPRDELERATQAYRQELLATLERGR
jgi:hypothetical protein